MNNSKAADPDNAFRSEPGSPEVRILFVACRAEAAPKAPWRRRAVIDVGTNSIKLLIADVSGHDVRPVHEESRQTRLGKGFYDTHRLQPEAIARTAEAVWEFAQIARERNAGSIRPRRPRAGHPE